MARHSKPLISCVMVTADRHDLCRRAIISYRNQTWSNTELIVLDNGRDKMDALLSDVPDAEVRYAHVPNDGSITIGELRNRSLELVRGDLVAPQWDDDDWSAPDRLELQHAALVESDAAACMLSASLMHVDDEDYFNHPFIGWLRGGVPPTLLHERNDDIRFPHLPRTSDTHYKNDWRSAGTVVMPLTYAHLHLRYFHGENIWERDHFLRRMRNRPKDLLAYGWWKFVRGDVKRHPRFRLSDKARRAFEQYLRDSEVAGLFDSRPV